jgi:hypothetical protein
MAQIQRRSDKVVSYTNLYCFKVDLLLHKHETHCRIKHRWKFTIMYTSDMNNLTSLVLHREHILNMAH